MSYAIVRSITIKNGEVFVCAASSNVYPKDFSQNESVSLSDILNNQGREILDEVIFGEFRKGNFQGLSTQYSKALVWQKQHGITCKDSELLGRFSKAWNEAGIVAKMG